MNVCSDKLMIINLLNGNSWTLNTARLLTVMLHQHHDYDLQRMEQSTTAGNSQTSLQPTLATIHWGRSRSGVGLSFVHAERDQSGSNDNWRRDRRRDGQPAAADNARRRRLQQRHDPLAGGQDHAVWISTIRLQHIKPMPR
jgi:hypothetical protein